MAACAVQFSIDNINKAGSVVNVERLGWINSRHVRALFNEEDISEDRKRENIVNILSFVRQGESLADAEHLISTFGVDYIWRSMALMAV